MKKGVRFRIAAGVLSAFCVAGVFAVAYAAAPRHTREPVNTQAVRMNPEGKKQAGTGGQSGSITQRAAAAVHDSAFSHTVFLGNSCIDDVRHYGIIKSAAFYTKVGLSVHSAYTMTDKKAGKTVLELLKGEKYKNVVLVLGANELDWNAQVFLSDYAKLLNAVRQRQPDAEIYIHAVLPVSRAASARNENAANHANVTKMNERLRAFAAENKVYFLDPKPVLADSEGYLLPNASPDGIHPNYRYCKIWMEYVEKVLGQSPDHPESNTN